MGIHKPDQENREYCKEHLLVLAKTLRSRLRAVDHDGSNWKFSNVTIIPPTATPSSPRFWVAAQRPDSVPWAVASCDDAGLPPMIFCSQLRRPFALVGQMLNEFRASLAEGERTRGVGTDGARFALNQMVHLAPSVDQARKEAATALYPLSRGIHNMMAAAGDARRYIRNGIVTEESPWRDPTEDELLDNVIVGDPDTAVEHIRKYRECGVDELSLHFNIGQSHELVTRSMKLFSTSVLPALQ
jgi:alkanesulfonate monooxygenase SsuD/methylene tetrahydromethanopterin reductase-like flavin-dependent oxidoreductase (luciferase family)